MAAALGPPVTRKTPSPLGLLLGLQPGDQRRTAAISGLHFVLGAVIIFMQAPAFGLFVSEFGSQRLPFAYLAIAVVVSALNLAYLKLSDRFAFVPLSLGILAFLAAGCFVLWLGLATPLRSAFIFILPVGFQLVLNVTVLVVWPLAGRAFDLREAKRTFGVIAGGNWVASLLLGLVLGPLIALLGTANLLLCAAAGALVALLLFGPVARVAGVWKPGTRPVPVAAGRKPRAVQQVPLRSLLSGPMIPPLLAYIVFLWIGYYFVDNIMYAAASLRFTGADQLGAFIGQVVVFYGILAAVMSIFLTGRILGRYGVRNALLVLPVLITMDMVCLVLVGTLRLSETGVFLLATLAKILYIGLGFSLSSTALTFLYQPLPPAIRGRTQALAEGVLQSLAIGLAGLLLLLFGSVLKLGPVGLSALMVLVGAALIATIVVLGRCYPQAVSAALVQRRLGEGPGLPVDRDTLALLTAHLADPAPGVVLYAMTTLEREDQAGWPDILEAALPRLLAHPVPEVRAEALHAAVRLGRRDNPRLSSPAALESNGQSPMVAIIAGHLDTEQQPDVQAAGVEAIASLRGASAAPFLIGFLGRGGPAETAAIAALLRLPGAPEAVRAEARLRELFESDDPAERVEAAEICRAAGRPEDAHVIRSLLSDTEVTVRRAALSAAGATRDDAVWGAVVFAAGQRETTRDAEAALAAGGEAALPAISAALARSGTSPGDADRLERISIANACARIGGARAVALLLDFLDSTDGGIRTSACRALAACQYRNPGDGASAIDREIQAGAAIAAALVALTPGPAALSAGPLPGPFVPALLSELGGVRERLLLLLSFRFDATALRSARDAFEGAGDARRAYALEAVETQLPASLRPRVMPLVELPPPAELASRLRSAGVEIPGWNKDQALLAVWGAAPGSGHSPDAGVDGLSPWTQAAAVYHASLSCPTALPALIQAGMRSPFELVRETASWAACRGEAQQSDGAPTMLSTVEKVLVLKRAGVFSETPAAILADVARACDEVEVEAGEPIVAKGEPGDSLYIIVQGRVRVRDGERVLNELGEGDVFGELALLDPEPRMATVTAIEPTRLLQLAQNPFHELIHERPEVALGVLRMITRYLRARVQDIAVLDAQLGERIKV